MSPTGWCELDVWKRCHDHNGQPVTPSTPHYNKRWSYRSATKVHVYDDKWENDFTLHKPHFRVRSHGEGQYDIGGHNWYMTTRFDVWFENPRDGYTWWGYLITGGDNQTFRIRRTLGSPFFQPDWRVLLDKVKRRPIKHPNIIRTEGDCLLIRDGREPLFVVKYFSDGQWRYAATVADLYAQRLLAA